MDIWGVTIAINFIREWRAGGFLHERIKQTAKFIFYKNFTDTKFCHVLVMKHSFKKMEVMR